MTTHVRSYLCIYQTSEKYIKEEFIIKALYKKYNSLSTTETVVSLYFCTTASDFLLNQSRRNLLVVKSVKV